MKLLKTLATAFAQYSRIPMPRFEWKEEDMRFSMAAFPLVGAVIGLIFAAVYNVSVKFSLPGAAAAMLMTAVPLIITGGFHLDGFMDVCDALSSYRSREEKLAILKDPHIGAFSVIRSLIVGLIYLASLIIILSSGNAAAIMYALAAGFVLSRGLSALAVLTFKSAKNDGMLYYEATAAKGARKANLFFACLFILISVGFMSYTGHISGSLVSTAAVLSFIWYKYLSYREFGGISGDTAGYFVVVCEMAMAAGGAVSALLIR